MALVISSHHWTSHWSTILIKSSQQDHLRSKEQYSRWPHKTTYAKGQTKSQKYTGSCHHGEILGVSGVLQMENTSLHLAPPTTKRETESLLGLSGYWKHTPIWVRCSVYWVIWNPSVCVAQRKRASLPIQAAVQVALPFNHTDPQMVMKLKVSTNGSMPWEATGEPLYENHSRDPYEFSGQLIPSLSHQNSFLEIIPVSSVW